MIEDYLLVLVPSVILMFATSALAGTWRDDFEDGKLDGWEVILGGVWTAENGVCIGKSMANISIIVVEVSDTSWIDYSVQADVKILEALPVVQHGAFIILRGNVLGAAFPYYMAGIVPLLRPRVVVLAHRNLANPWIDVPLSIELNTWYRLKMIAEGNHFDVYLDGTLIKSFDDGTYASGRAGLGILQADAHFDNVIITGDAVPGLPSDDKAVEPKDKLATTWAEIKKQ